MDPAIANRIRVQSLERAMTDLAAIGELLGLSVQPIVRYPDPDVRSCRTAEWIANYLALIRAELSTTETLEDESPNAPQETGGEIPPTLPLARRRGRPRKVQ